jgi:Glycosyltransferase family 87
MRRLSLLGLLLALVLLLVPAGASADTVLGLPVQPPASMTTPPPYFSTNGRQAIEIAERQPAFAAAQRKHPRSTVDVQVYNNSFWQISLVEKDTDRIPVVVDITAGGRIMDVNTGVAASSYIGRPGVDHTFRKPWVWLTFGLAFLLPFVDLRRLRRMLHLDLAVMLGFGVSYAIIEQGGHSNVAVVMVYPPLLYLLVRMLRVGLRPRRPSGRLVPHLPTWALIVGLLALCGGRVALNLHNDKVIDIGYASVGGADRITHKQPLYTDNDFHGDTYGPVSYLAYVPFEQLLPFKGGYDSLGAAHAGAIFFDLLTIVGLVLLGLRFRAGPEGRRLGLAMAWAFAACPFTLLTVLENTNDGLVALLLVWMLVFLSSAPVRGLLLGLATAAKFSPGALLLLVARGRSDEDGRRQWVQTAAVCLGIFVFTIAIYWPKEADGFNTHGGLQALWNCTLGYQLSRSPDFSLWAVFFNIGWTQKLLEVAAIGVMLVAGFWPGRRTLTEISALAAAILIALQLPGGHWYYFYISWFAPLVIVALFTRHVLPLAAAVERPRRDEEPAELRGVGLGRLAA